MKIYELIKKINTKTTVKNVDVLSIKKYYMSLYKAYMVTMYDKGYISDPTSFNIREIYKNIVDMNIKYLTGVTGKIDLSEDYIGFTLAKYRNSGDREIVSFLELLLKVVKYRNISINIDKFFDDCGLMETSKKKISLNTVQAASRIYFKNGFDLDEGILKCMFGFENKFDFVSLNSVIYDTALVELNLDEVDEEGSLFVSGLTREDEVLYSELILNGMVQLDGRYADRLTNWLKNNKWADGNKFSSQKEGLYNWVLYIKSNQAIEEQSKLLNSILDGGNEIVAMKSNGFYVKSHETVIDVPIGSFVIMSNFTDDEVLPHINKLEGYSGEGYSLSFLNNNGVSFVGCPIEVVGSNNKKVLLVDKEQTDMKDSISWFKSIGASLSFSDNLLHNSFEEGSIQEKLQEALLEAEKGNMIYQVNINDYLSINDSMKRNVIDSIVWGD